MGNEEELKSKPILDLANKRDLHNTMRIDEIREKLQLNELVEADTKVYLEANAVKANRKIDVKQPLVETMNDSKAMTDDLFSVMSSMNFKIIINKLIHFSAWACWLSYPHKVLKVNI